MNTATLYRDLTVQGVTLYLDGGALRYRAPKGKMTPDVLANIKAHKLELVSLLATNDPYENNINSIESIVRKSNRESDNISTWSMDRYAHLVTCKQCEHLTLTGHCSVKPQYKPQPEALRKCDSFELLKSERLSIVKVTPYTATELLTHYEKPLFNHLLTCPYCHVEKAQYCLNGYAMGSVYDALLLNCDDAQLRRESLALRVDKACISGRSVFVPFNPINAPPPPNTALQTRKWGNTPQYEAFINHWTACKVCKPNLGRYCSEGQRLEKEVYNNN